MSEMEDNGVTITYNTYWTVFMGKESELLTSLFLLRDFTTRKRLRSATTMVIIMFAMLFIMGWPTIASAMTAYDSINYGYVSMTDNTQVAFSAFRPILYVIHDGERVNLSSNYPVPYCNGSCKSSQPLTFLISIFAFMTCDDFEGATCVVPS